MKKDRAIIDRRGFFKLSLLGGVAVASGLGGVLSQAAAADKSAKKSAEKSSGHAAKSGPVAAASGRARARMFLQSQRDFDNLSAACERIYPKDEAGPGAIELGAPYFVDNQLAAGYGYNAREYLAGPFFEGGAWQNYQTPLRRNEIFLAGIKALESQAQKKFKRSFSALSASAQDEILKGFEAGKVELVGVSSAYFFSLLRDATLAGVLSDPAYGGNDNKNGWRMMGYPGAQMSYLDKIQSDEFFDIEPLSLADMEA